MRWTKKQPAKEGWYWTTTPSKINKFMVWVDSNLNYRYFGKPKYSYPVKADPPGCFWAGPIPEPEEVKKEMERIKKI